MLIRCILISEATTGKALFTSSIFRKLLSPAIKNAKQHTTGWQFFLKKNN
jgi:hypothetical protein